MNEKMKLAVAFVGRRDAVSVLRDLLEKIDVMGGCNEHDMQGADAWPEFVAAQALIDSETML